MCLLRVLLAALKAPSFTRNQTPPRVRLPCLLPVPLFMMHLPLLPWSPLEAYGEGGKEDSTGRGHAEVQAAGEEEDSTEEDEWVRARQD